MMVHAQCRHTVSLLAASVLRRGCIQQQGVWRGSAIRRASTASTNAVYNLASPGNSFISIQLGDASLPETVSSEDLAIYPEFLSAEEQAILLSASLKKLDAMGSREERKRRREWQKKSADKQKATEMMDFLPDEVYDFQQKHFDGVISGYRETTLSEWLPFSSEATNASLAGILSKAYALVPSASSSRGAASQDAGLRTPSRLMTHLLHMASDGYIQAHVDNVQASAGTILGLCLGAERHLILRPKDDPSRGSIRLRLPAGCAYVQRGRIRYDWTHEIPRADKSDASQIGQRLSVMMRDRLS